MKKVNLLFLCILILAATGCVSKSRYQREVGDLQNQVAQKDAELRAEQEKIQVQQGKKFAPGAFTGANYRTPSGFEISASQVQKALKNAGYYAGGMDGKIGPSSREAIRNFQHDNGLTADGVCGKATWAKLKTHLETAG